MRLAATLSVVFSLVPLFGLVAADGKEVIIVRSSKHLPAHHHNHPPLHSIARPVYHHPGPSHHHAQPLPVHHQHGKASKGGGLGVGITGICKRMATATSKLIKGKGDKSKEEKVHNDPVHVLVKEAPPKVKHVRVLVREQHHNGHECGHKWLKNLQKNLKKSQKQYSKHHHKESPLVFFHTQTPYYYYTQPPRRYYNNYYNGYGHDHDRY
uniref:Putative secreted protein n=1 Tax=Ixodes ricinus TaxID=34613 RepID=A0A090X9C0_IXORI